MRVRIPGMEIAAGLLALCAAGLATAAPCYVIIDRDDAVVYRDTAPPFDLSTDGASDRAMLRQRGQLLLIAEFDRCNAVGYISPVTGATTATVDEIVMQVKPAIASSVGSTRGAVTSGSSGGVARAAPRAAPRSSPPAAAAVSRRY